ncbi:MAG TPA: GntR family transcriptional regulator [Kiloniellales bacterium]|nr:GntR family transcriptional regulator [Kiloniellales bacterium]
MRAPKLSPIAASLVHERVYSALADAVMAGAFVPGQKVTVRELASRFATSPMPVREAIRRLVTQQAFEALPNRTVRVPAFSPAKVQDLCRVRCMLEGTAAAWAAERATPELVAKVRKLLNVELAAFQRDDLHRLLQADRELHLTVWRGAEAPSLLPCCEMLRLQIGPYLGELVCDARLLATLEEHGRLADALERRDPAGAREAIARNIATSADHAIDLWSKRTEKSVA